jgi:sulfatase modifying factor 1
MRTRFVPRAWGSIYPLVWFALGASACALIETGPDSNSADYAAIEQVRISPRPTGEVRADSTAAEEAPPVTVSSTAEADASTAIPSVTGSAATPASAPCKPGMLEVKGLYCLDVMHRCVKGGRTHTQEPTEEPEPFYCDSYQPGFAHCLDGKQVPKHFCIDQYEYPNQAGTIPTVMVSWYEAKRLCEAQGKRLCGDDEWTLACEGPERFPYPYGWTRDRAACNIDRLWIQPNDAILGSRSASQIQIQAEVDRLSKRVASGSMPRCKSPYGVMDMAGNVDEWTVNITLEGKPYASAFKGGHWISGARNRCRAVTVSHDESTYYYSEGFRCCADPDAEATPVQ